MEIPTVLLRLAEQLPSGPRRRISSLGVGVGGKKKERENKRERKEEGEKGRERKGSRSAEPISPRACCQWHEEVCLIHPSQILRHLDCCPTLRGMRGEIGEPGPSTKASSDLYFDVRTSSSEPEVASHAVFTGPCRFIGGLTSIRSSWRGRLVLECPYNHRQPSAASIATHHPQQVFAKSHIPAHRPRWVLRHR